LLTIEGSLHVNIFDTAKEQYTIPKSVVELPGIPSKSFKSTSDLIFNYESSPFAFWITRRSQPQSPPLFDMRIASFPQTPIPPVIASDNSTALDGFPLIFEDQYLQVCISHAIPIWILTILAVGFSSSPGHKYLRIR
jgi:alpha-glucosidase